MAHLTNKVSTHKQILRIFWQSNRLLKQDKSSMQVLTRSPVIEWKEPRINENDQLQQDHTRRTNAERHGHILLGNELPDCMLAGPFNFSSVNKRPGHIPRGIWNKVREETDPDEVDLSTLNQVIELRQRLRQRRKELVFVGQSKNLGSKTKQVFLMLCPLV